MIYLSQRDPRWQNITLGNSRYTIGRYGCTTTCISMLSDYFQCFQPPDAIAKSYCQYTLDGYILWNTLTLPRMGFKVRLYGQDDVAIQQALKDPRQAVILNVSNGGHWVVAIRKTLFGNDYVCVDPWTGKICLAKRDYRNIVGAAIFNLK